MKTLLSQSAPKRAIIIAETNEDVRTLRILFNNKILYGCYAMWTPIDEKDLPENHLIKYNPLAYVELHTPNDNIEDITREEKYKKVSDAAIEESKKRELTKPAEDTNLFEFLK